MLCETQAAAGMGIDAAALAAEPCRPQILLAPFGDKDDGPWPLYTGF